MKLRLFRRLISLLEESEVRRCFSRRRQVRTDSRESISPERNSRCEEKKAPSISREEIYPERERTKKRRRRRGSISKASETSSARRTEKKKPMIYEPLAYGPDLVPPSAIGINTYSADRIAFLPIQFRNLT